MATHFLLTAKARTLSLAAVLRMSEEEAHAAFCEIRWSANEGKPFCPHCGGVEIYTYTARRIFKCRACRKQFSVTSGTIFHSRKLAIRDYLAAIAIFVNAVKGVSALQLGRDLDVAYNDRIRFEPQAPRSDGSRGSGRWRTSGHRGNRRRVFRRP
jgi:transposase-like protein